MRARWVNAVALAVGLLVTFAGHPSPSAAGATHAPHAYASQATHDVAELFIGEPPPGPQVIEHERHQGPAAAAIVTPSRTAFPPAGVARPASERRPLATIQCSMLGSRGPPSERTPI